MDCGASIERCEDRFVRRGLEFLARPGKSFSTCVRYWSDNGRHSRFRQTGFAGRRDTSHELWMVHIYAALARDGYEVCMEGPSLRAVLGLPRTSLFACATASHAHNPLWSSALTRHSRVAWRHDRR